MYLLFKFLEPFASFHVCSYVNVTTTLSKMYVLFEILGPWSILQPWKYYFLSYRTRFGRTWLYGEVIVRKFPAINLDVPLSNFEQLSLNVLCTSLVFRHPGGRLGDVNRLTVKLFRRWREGMARIDNEEISCYQFRCVSLKDTIFAQAWYFIILGYDVSRVVLTSGRLGDLNKLTVVLFRR